MVEDHITDGKRIAQLLASELTGLEEGPLENVEVIDADPDAMPADSGIEAYQIHHRSKPVAAVSLHPEHAVISFQTDRSLPETPLTVQGGTDLEVTSGAEVKRAVDAIRYAVSDRS